MRQGKLVVVPLAALALLVTAALSGCSDAPTAPEVCDVVQLVHVAYNDLADAAVAAGAGDNRAASASGASAVTRAGIVVEQIGRIGPGGPEEQELRQMLTGASIGVDQFGRIMADPETTSEEKAEFAATGFSLIEQMLGSVDALAIEGSDGTGGVCPGFVRSGTPLPTLAPRATPSDGPTPPGSAEDQASVALASLGLQSADGIEFQVGSPVQWLPGRNIFVGSIELTNRTAGLVQFPFDLTLLRWDGKAWTKVGCLDVDNLTTGPISGLCGVVNGNLQAMGPGTIRSTAEEVRLNFDLAGPDGIPPGTYALLLPIWRTDAEFVETEPTEAAVAIVTVTSTP